MLQPPLTEQEPFPLQQADTHNICSLDSVCQIKTCKWPKIYIPIILKVRYLKVKLNLLRKTTTKKQIELVRKKVACSYLNGVSPGFLCRVIFSNCLPFLATKLANLSATCLTVISFGGGGAACHLKNWLISSAWQGNANYCSRPSNSLNHILPSNVNLVNL